MALLETTEPTIPEWSQGDRFEKARSWARLTQDQMAETLSAKLGRPVSKQTISNWENDIAQPRKVAAVIAAWSEITGVDEAWIAGFRTGSFSTPLAIVPSPTTPQPEQLSLDAELDARTRRAELASV